MDIGDCELRYLVVKGANVIFEEIVGAAEAETDLEDVASLLHTLTLEHAHLCKPLNCVLYRLQHARLVELQGTLLVKGFNDPLKLLIERFFFLRLSEIDLGSEESQSYSISVNEGEDLLTQEGLFHFHLIICC